MNKEELLKSVENPNFIEGIYNYCDRWCEKCQFTSRCLQYSLEEQQNSQLKEKDITNASFWQQVQESLKLALEMIKDMAEEQGIDLNSIEIDEDDEDKENLISMLTHRAKIYADMVNDWFDNNQYLFENKGKGDKQAINPHLQVVTSPETQPSITIGEMKEIIRWYQYQIYVKLSRAISSKKREQSLPLDEFPKDSDGSAKVALIGIDRSLCAWSKLLPYFKRHKTSITKMMTFLKSLRDLTEAEFPHARDFIRVGFDD